MTATEFWRDLESRFLRLHSVKGNDLAANWTSTFWFEPGDQWKLSGGGPDPSVPGQFKILARCGAIRLGYSDGATAEAYWLDEMRRESPAFRGGGRSENLTEISEIGFIWSVCSASAQFCINCENKEILDSKHSQRQLTQTRVDVAALVSKAELLWAQGEVVEQEKLQAELAIGEGIRNGFSLRTSKKFALYEAFFRRSAASRCSIYKTVAEGPGNEVLFSQMNLADLRERMIDSINPTMQVLQNRISRDHTISGHPPSLPAISSYAVLHKAMVRIVKDQMKSLEDLETQNQVSMNTFTVERDDEKTLAQVRCAFVMPLLAKKRWKRGRWATKAGVGKNSVYEYLDGKRKLSPENREAMAQVLGVKSDELPE